MTQVTPPTLEVRNLHKRFGPLEVLKGIDFKAHESEVISILGASGSGKSTLLRCLNLLEAPEEGQLFFAGEEIRLTDRPGHRHAADARQLRRMRTQLGMVFQNFNLWPHRTVLENVIEVPVHVQGVPRAEAVEQAESLLARVGLADKRDVHPSFLSGGQQQRAAIARALAIRPRALLFDEPTSALDPELVGEVLKVIRGLAEEGRTMILVTHEVRFARDVSDRCLFMHQGQIEEDGHPDQFFTAQKSERCRQFLSASH